MDSVNIELFLIKLLPEIYLNIVPITLSILYIVFALFFLKLYSKKISFLKHSSSSIKKLIVLLPTLIIILFFIYPKLPNRTEHFDVDGDGYSQTKYVYQWWKEKLIEVDANNDKRVDDWSFYNSDGKLERNELDTNFDGKVNFWTYYDKNLNPIRIETDNNFDGNKDSPKEEEILNDNDFSTTTLLKPISPNFTLYYYSNGKLTKIENKIEDKVYMIDYFTKDGKIIKSEMFNNDGKLDSITHYDSQGKETKTESLIDGKWQIYSIEE